ncbi:MAG: hypothetical protein GX560_04280 [Deinococcales bacterium]|nr:hypothetical protein [Deinococcales bacterium]
MPFGSRKRRGDPRLEEWARFAAEFELEPADGLAETLRHRFALGDGELTPIYALERRGQPQLIAFDQRRLRTGPAGSVTNLRTFVAVRSESDHGAPSLRASARRSKAFEALEASRSGAQRVELPDDPGFDRSVSVFLRDVEAARATLTRPVREVLQRLLGAADAAVGALNVTHSGSLQQTTVAPSVVVGQRNLLLCLEPRQPLPVSGLATLLVDMLSLQAALESAHVRIEGALLE